MDRIGSAVLWSVLGLIAGAIIGAIAGFVMGVLRTENVVQAGLAGALPVGLIGALGAFAGHLLEKPSEESDSLTAMATFFGAILGGLIGKLIGVALGADVWLLESISAVEIEGVLVFLLYHIDLVGGPHVVVGAFLGILTIGVVDTFLGESSSFHILVVASLLTPAVAIVAALGGQIDWGATFAIVVGTIVIFAMLAKSGGPGVGKSKG